jgi:predicted enzyme related to lactoylglutathione lyase
MIKAVKFVNVPVKDQDRALEFYTQKLGFKVMTDQPMGPQRWIELSPNGGSGTGVSLFTPEGHESRVGTFTGISFLTDSVEKTYEMLTGKGVEFTGPPKKEPWGMFAMFKDSEGNQFVLSGR